MKENIIIATAFDLKKIILLFVHTTPLFSNSKKIMLFSNVGK
jgi:hypothetical protein